jgi:hypothetical protein
MLQVMCLCSWFFGGVVLLCAFFVPLALFRVLTLIQYVWLARVSNLYGVPCE